MSKCLAGAFITLFAAFVPAAQGADERFQKDRPDSKNGFATADDPVYRKECGSCHFAYLPGLFPARSWTAMMNSLGTHYGEVVNMPRATADQIGAYLTRNAADNSDYEGSKLILVRVKPDSTPSRITNLPHLVTMHRVTMEMMGISNKIKSRGLTNCNTCHVNAERGSFGLDELVIPGLTRTGR